MFCSHRSLAIGAFIASASISGTLGCVTDPFPFGTDKKSNTRTGLAAPSIEGVFPSVVPARVELTSLQDPLTRDIVEGPIVRLIEISGEGFGRITGSPQPTLPRFTLARDLWRSANTLPFVEPGNF